MAAYDRRPKRGNLATRLYEAYDERAVAASVVAVAPPFQYPLGKVFGPIAAVDDAPNTTEPANTRIIFGATDHPATVSRIAITPFWTVAAQAAGYRVWARTGLTGAGEPKWTLLKIVALAGDGTDLEQVVDVGFRDVFIQVVSGVDAGHPLSLAVAVS